MKKNVLKLLPLLMALLFASCEKKELKETPLPKEEGTMLKSASSESFSITPWEMIKLMGRGTNLGNTLEPPYEGAWALSAREYYFDDYKEAGYKTVRIPVRWENHMMSYAPYTIDAAWLSRVKQIVNWSLERGFVTIINSHHDDWIKNEYQGKKTQFKEMWKQIAHYFKDMPETLLFEIINEPHGSITVNQSNEIQHEVLEIIRVENPKRITIITGPDWAHFGNLINEAVIPNDPYIIGTFHYYDPWSFAGEYQGTWGTQQDIAKCEANFQKAEDWAVRKNVPILVGEFGVRTAAHKASRLKWFETVANKAIEHGFATTVWDDGGWFQLYDRASRTWDDEVMALIIKEDEDAEAPTAPSGLVSEVTNQSTISLNWLVSTDNVGVKAYKVFVNDAFYKSTLENSTVLQGMAAGSYDIYVKAVDEAGNQSENSEVVNVVIELIPDDEAPSVPQNLSGQVVGKNIQLSWEAATDNIGVTGYNIYENGALVKASSSIHTTIGDKPVGTYVYLVTALDASGNESEQSESVSVTVEPASGNFSLEVETKSSWNGGFSCELKIVNNSTASISSWELIADMDFSIANAWNCNKTNSGSNHTFSNLGWNGQIAPGNSVAVGFVANGALSEGSISNATINGEIVEVTFK